MSVMRRYTFKIYPTASQEAALSNTARMCAELWNALLQRREDVYRREKRTLTAFDLGKEITDLRAALPEWRAMPRSIQERVCGDLDNAFKAFFRRAKQGAGYQSGYPRYKRTLEATSIPFREMSKGGWSFHRAPEIAGKPASGPCGAGREGGFASTGAGNSTAIAAAYDKVSCGGAAIAVEAQDVDPHSAVGVSCGDSASAVEAQGWHPREPLAPACGGAAIAVETQVLEDAAGPCAQKNWRLRIGGVPGLIRARGKFPSDPLSIKTGDVMFRDGAWWLSVAVEIERQRERGVEDLKVEFDLIDEFARVERANGECVADRFSNAETMNLTTLPEACSASGAEASKMGAERRRLIASASRIAGSGTSRMDVPNVIDDRQSAMDRKFKRGSRRWKAERARLSKQSAKVARRRREALHRWTTSLIRLASDLTVVAPPVKDHTKSPRGNEQFPGAAVEPVSALNRAVLSRAPAMAVQMLEYKAAEAGIGCRVVVRDEHHTAVGRELVAAAKMARRARRTLKMEIEA